MTSLSESCCCYHKGTYFQANHNIEFSWTQTVSVVVATTKVRIFKQITTGYYLDRLIFELLLLPQRYVFSSKSQLLHLSVLRMLGCCCYHKGTYFQANHNIWDILLLNWRLLLLPQRYVFSSKSQLLPFGGIGGLSCCCYHKGTYFQANHNTYSCRCFSATVVVATTKVRIFKQITTMLTHLVLQVVLLLLPQRYVFSSKSQLKVRMYRANVCCCCYHKGTYFQANHNRRNWSVSLQTVVVATTKVRIFKQITTSSSTWLCHWCCCCYHKGTYFQANHNQHRKHLYQRGLLLLPQRYVFSSKSQPIIHKYRVCVGCCCYHKGTYFQANHTPPITIVP